jgi:hypothetical protein
VMPVKIYRRQNGDTQLVELPRKAGQDRTGEGIHDDRLARLYDCSVDDCFYFCTALNLDGPADKNVGASCRWWGLSYA